MNLISWLAYKQSIPKITYLQGANLTIRRLALSSLRKKLKPSEIVNVDLTFDSEEFLWNSLSRYPTDPDSPILVVVENVERVQDWTRLKILHSTLMVNHVVFISDNKIEETHFLYDFLKKKAKFVDCDSLSDEELILLMGSFGLPKKSADLLLDRTSGNLKDILNVIEKAKALDNYSPEVIKLLSKESALDSFSDYLIFGHKSAAVEALNNMTAEDSLREVQFLFSRMSLFQQINQASMFNNKYAPEIAQEIGVKVFLIKKYGKIAKVYDSRKILEKKTLLVATDSALRDGNSHALLALAAMW